MYLIQQEHAKLYTVLHNNQEVIVCVYNINCIINTSISYETKYIPWQLLQIPVHFSLPRES